MDHLGKSWLWFRKWLVIRELGLVHCWALTRLLPWENTVSVLPSDVFLLILISFPGSSSSVSFIEIPDYLSSTPSRLKAISKGYTYSRLSRNILYQWEQPPAPPPDSVLIIFCQIKRKMLILDHRWWPAGGKSWVDFSDSKVNHKCRDKGIIIFNIVRVDNSRENPGKQAL